MKQKFKKIIAFEPAYDKRKEKCGIHGVDIRFVLKGKDGAVQFLLFTNWQLPHVTEEEVNRLEHHNASSIKLFFTPMPADLGYHSPKPMYEDHRQAVDKCEYLDGKPCYYDGSSLNAEPIYRKLLKYGAKGVWEALEKYYNDTFKEGKNND